MSAGTQDRFGALLGVRAGVGGGEELRLWVPCLTPTDGTWVARPAGWPDTLPTVDGKQVMFDLTFPVDAEPADALSRATFRAQTRAQMPLERPHATGTR